ncbi:MAG: ABC transporter permease [Thermoleophilia bacterium]|nr:ABC transporter permease [Gaiellaceae bacterium]MDW8337946.1 ABC transporter permease [Thermoleophilia bacterium]
MLQYIIRRLLYSTVVLVAASFLVFLLVAKGAGDPLAPYYLAPNIDTANLDRIAEEKHLNDSIFVRYAYWVRDAVTNKFGTTLLTNEPILPDLWRVMKNTLQLVVAAELLAVLFAVAIGVYSALRQYSIFDYTATTFSFLGLATPVFWLALMLQVAVVQIYLHTGYRIFPVANLNSVDPGTGLSFILDRAHHLVLPVLVLMVASIATYSRYMRASMLEVVNSDYVRTARAKGLPESKVTMKHAFRNALIPLVTLVALNFGALLGGAIVTETVFSLDGMGLYFVNALNAGDPYPIMAWLMVTATMIILFNLIADIAYGILDPRVRYD